MNMLKNWIHQCAKPSQFSMHLHGCNTKSAFEERRPGMCRKYLLKSPNPYAKGRQY